MGNGSVNGNDKSQDLSLALHTTTHWAWGYSPATRIIDGGDTIQLRFIYDSLYPVWPGCSHLIKVHQVAMSICLVFAGKGVYENSDP